MSCLILKHAASSPCLAGLPASKPAASSTAQAVIIFTGTDINEWDVAAAEGIVLGAGGLFTDLEGERIVYNKPRPKIFGLAVSFSEERDIGILSAIFREKLGTSQQ